VRLFKEAVSWKITSIYCLELTALYPLDLYRQHLTLQCTVWVKKISPEVFSHFYLTVGNLQSKFYKHIWRARLQIFIQLSATVTKLCHIKRDHPVHIICSKCPPSAETHAGRSHNFLTVGDNWIKICNLAYIERIIGMWKLAYLPVRALDSHKSLV